MTDSKKQNPWSGYEVAKSLGYLENFNSTSKDFETFFQEIRKLSDFKNIKILDIGCGNARKAFELARIFPNKNFYYFGIDVNRFCIEAAYKNFDLIKPNNLKLELHLRDLNKEEIHFNEKFDYAICDSVINMVEEPKKIVELMSVFAKNVFLCRVKQTRNKESIIKSYNAWSGMEVPSVNWSFNEDFFIKIFDKTSKTIFIDNKTYNDMFVWIREEEKNED